MGAGISSETASYDWRSDQLRANICACDALYRRKPGVWVSVVFLQSEVQLSSSVRLKILLLSLNCSLISAEQLGELKIMRHVHCCHWQPHKRSTSIWKGKNWSDFVGLSGHSSVNMPKQQQKESRALRSTVGCEQGRERGEYGFWWSWCPCQFYWHDGTLQKWGGGRWAGAQPVCLTCLSAAGCALAERRWCGDLCYACSAQRRIHFLW